MPKLDTLRFIQLLSDLKLTTNRNLDYSLEALALKLQTPQTSRTPPEPCSYSCQLEARLYELLNPTVVYKLSERERVYIARLLPAYKS